MSEIRVDTIISHAGNSAPDFPQGANLSGVTTVSSMKVGSGITADSSGVNVTGIVTASSGFVGDVTGDVTGSSSPTVKINDGATEKGYIGYNGNDPFIGRKNGVGLAFQNNKVRPVDGDDGSASNNTVDLGEPTYKFKDLHLAGDAKIDGSISGVSSVTATTFYGSGAGLGGVPGGLDSIDRWQVQGNADRIDGTGVYQKLIMYGGSAGSGGCTTGTWYFSARDMSTRPTFFPHAIGAGVSFYSQEGGYTSNTDCHAGKDLTSVEASAGIVTFPSTGTWQITWDIVACVCSGGRLQFGIECTANIGAATTVWGSVFPHLWNFCKIQEPHYCDTGNRCCGIKHMYFETASTVHTYTRQIEAYVSVANTNQTGVRFSWGRDSNSNWITGGTGWTYKKVSNTAPW